MIEASIVMPIIILVIMLLLRLFVFYLQILNTGINEHDKALAEWDKYSGKTIKVYESNREVNMLRGGILGMDLRKEIETKAYFFNEDFLVRSGEVVKKQ